MYDELLETGPSTNTLVSAGADDEETAEASSKLEELVRAEEAESEQALASNSRNLRATPRWILAKGQYFRDPRGISRTVTYPLPIYGYPEYSGGNHRCSSDDRNAPASEVPSDPTLPSSPKRPLEHLLLQIGKRVLRFRVVDRVAQVHPPTIEERTRSMATSIGEEEPCCSQWSPDAETVPGNLPNTTTDAVDDQTLQEDEVPGSYGCNMCPAVFSSGDELLKHNHMHSAQATFKPFLCSVRGCAKSFSTEQSLSLHEKYHDVEKPYVCEVCAKSFSRQHNYAVHLKLHQSGRRVFCSCCGRWFRSLDSLYEHQIACESRLPGEAIPSERPLRFKCSYCDKMFHHKRDKTIHERVHTGERPYTCGYCNKGFTQSQALTVHIRTHTGEKPYSCALCEETFRDTSSLRKHEAKRHPLARWAVYSDMLGGQMSSLEEQEWDEEYATI